MNIRFPENFIFGAATSAFQIEGNVHDDGSGKSIWSSFIQNSTVGSQEDEYAKSETFCLHSSYWKRDVSLLSELKLDSYRFSVSWGRVIPSGNGNVNQKGLQFYDQLVDNLLEHGITPMLTLYHWDLPLELQKNGGWANPNSPDWFLLYSKTVADLLADRVPLWITFNEPWIFMHLGMIQGEHAPGIKSPEYAAAAYKNILLSHSRTADLLRSYNQIREIGIASNLSPCIPASPSPADVAASKRMDAYHNRFFLDPWVNGSIPEITDQVFGKHNPEWSDSELNELGSELDFIGINYYTSKRIAHHDHDFLNVTEHPPQTETTDMGWEINPDGLLEALIWAYEQYNTPLYVTENGAAFNDVIQNGKIEDYSRVRYLHDHILQCKKAIEQNIPLKGYYVWSLLDNYEWNHGLTKRFGLIHVDFETYNRTIKQSGYYYRNLISFNRHPNTSDLKSRRGLNLDFLDNFQAAYTQGQPAGT